MLGDFVTKAELKSQDGSKRLRLICVEVESDGLDFHSLTLEAHSNGEWVPELVINRAQFQGQHEHRRWIADLHSFVPNHNRAIIQVAEGDRPPNSFPIHYVYSWRRWDLSSNSQLAVLRVCKSPFEPL